MATTPTPREIELANARIARLTAEFSRKRNVGILLAILFAVLSAGVFVSGQPMLAFCSVMLALIFVVRSVDAQGQVGEVSRRSTNNLYSRLSLLQNETASSPAEHSSKQ
jgi:uncharacterized small protein (DUF1192 family)